MTFATSKHEQLSGRPMVLAWKLQRANPRYASVRYRCLMPLLRLREVGFPSVVLSGGDDIHDFSQVRALIFVKAFSDHDVDLALRAHKAEVPVVFDLCENIFVSEFGGSLNAEVQRNFQRIVAVAAGVVTTGPAMAEEIVSHLPSALPIWVIPDQIESYEQTALLLQRSTWSVDPQQIRIDGPEGVVDLSIKVKTRRFRWLPTQIIDRRWLARGFRKGVKAVTRRLERLVHSGRALRTKGRRRLHRLVPKPFLRRMRAAYSSLRANIWGHAFAFPVNNDTQPMVTADKSDNLRRKTVIWFGLSGSSHGRVGMITLSECLVNLARFDQIVPLRLCVVSNNREMFNELFRAIPFPVEYHAWDPLLIFDQVRRADVCILPNSRDAFSRTKSANRAVLALSLGVPVIATSIPSIDPLQGNVVLDNWDAGLRRYLGDPEATRMDLAGASDVIDKIYSPDAVGEAWRRVIAGLDPSMSQERPPSRPSPVEGRVPLNVAYGERDHPKPTDGRDIKWLRTG